MPGNKLYRKFSQAFLGLCGKLQALCCSEAETSLSFILRAIEFIFLALYLAQNKWILLMSLAVIFNFISN